LQRQQVKIKETRGKEAGEEAMVEEGVEAELEGIKGSITFTFNVFNCM